MRFIFIPVIFFQGLDKSGKPLLSVYFKVQLYVEHVSLLK